LSFVAFNKVGAALLTCKCLSNDKVCVEVDPDVDGKQDPQAQLMLSMEEIGNCAVVHLVVAGYEKVQMLLVKAKRKQRMINHQVTVPHTKERLAVNLNAKTTGAKYVAMEGGHLNHDNMFLADELKQRNVQVAALKSDCNKRFVLQQQQDDAFAHIAQKEDEENLPLANILLDQKKWKNTEVDILLKWK